jgi:hypothetical protein
MGSIIRVKYLSRSIGLKILSRIFMRDNRNPMQEFDPAAFRRRGPDWVERGRVQLVGRAGVTLDEVIVLKVGRSTLQPCGVVFEEIELLEIYLTAEHHFFSFNWAKI